MKGKQNLTTGFTQMKNLMKQFENNPILIKCSSCG